MATLDLLSHGRTILGIGSGWLKEEFDALGLDFHPRGARTDEAMQALRALWNDNPSSFHGKQFNFGPVMSFPKPAQKGGVPIHVGGHSPAAARRAGRLGDGFFPAHRRNPEAQRTVRADARGGGQARPQGRRDRALVHGHAPASIRSRSSRISEFRASWCAPPGFDKDNLTRGLDQLGNDVIAKL